RHDGVAASRGRIVAVAGIHAVAAARVVAFAGAAAADAQPVTTDEGAVFVVVLVAVRAVGVVVLVAVVVVLVAVVVVVAGSLVGVVAVVAVADNAATILVVVAAVVGPGMGAVRAQCHDRNSREKQVLVHSASNRVGSALDRFFVTRRRSPTGIVGLRLVRSGTSAWAEQLHRSVAGTGVERRRRRNRDRVLDGVVDTG